MRIVVTDACIFIDLIELELADKFFRLDLEIHTTVDVLNELYPAQQQVLQRYQQSEKLFIHILSHDEQAEIHDEDFPISLSPEDCSVIYIAYKLDAVVLSSDKAVRNYARKKAIDYHGMIWLFDRLVEQELITRREAIDGLRQLVLGNMIYKGNPNMIREFEKRVKVWSK